MPLLEAKEITKTFHHPEPVTILDGLNLSVDEGETVAILGRSGQGKSTLLQILGTLDDPSSGSLLVEGNPVNRWNTPFLRNREMGFVFQSFHLLEDETALQNILMPAKIGREPTHSSSKATLRAWELLEEIELKDRAHTPAKWLSGGEKQRISLARAMINQPKILFADEPSGNLDRETAQHIHSLLLNFAHNSRSALVIVTHDPSLANLCQTEYQLKDGVLRG